MISLAGRFSIGSRDSTARIIARRATSSKSRRSWLPSEDILRLFFGLDYKRDAAPPLLHAVVDLTPEHLEIVDSGSDRANHDEPEKNSAERLQGRMVGGKDDDAAGDHLENHFCLAECRGGNQ